MNVEKKNIRTAQVGRHARRFVIILKGVRENISVCKRVEWRKKEARSK